MAGIDVGSSGGRRSLNSEINMIPFIDLLMVTIAFLLITAVWVTNSRIASNAEVPGQAGCQGDCKPDTSPVLHVSVGEHDFGLVWKQEGTVISETRVPKPEERAGEPARFDDLAKAVTREWASHRSHSDPSDKKSDTAVLHSDDRAAFRDLVGVLDAIHATQRDYKLEGGTLVKGAAFATTFAAR
jgi:biopolymer transport protein ExbD